MDYTPVRPDGEIERIVDEYASELFRLCLVMLKNTHDAEDTVQDTLLSYLQHAPEFESRESERSWLLTVAANRCRDSLRRAKRHPSVSMDELTELGATDEHALVLDALMALPEKFRLVLTLHYVEGYSTSEIAGMIGRTPSAVKMRLQKGRRLLEDTLGKE
ncbi:MAG TPA: RNA polymerase sigma factor, partial [Candidatus Scatomorpha gallistercoris]|nr:RNA polymerase sigma factor [Candidatus Scatomorpha gallistercoris]